jgi:methionyl-tRNA formyltransferase
VVFFGAGGDYSRIVLEKVIDQVELLAVVVPAARGRGLRRFVSERRLRFFSRRFRRLAHQTGAPLMTYGPDLAQRLAPLAPDLFVIAAFPHILREPLLRVPRVGAVNAHPGLLPRHRGADPIFWTFFDDDAEAGPTLHWVDAGVDTGDVISQEIFPIEPGSNRAQLSARIAAAAGELLAGQLPAIADGSAPRLPQDPSLAKHEPLPRRDNWSLDYDRWSASRVWRFLRGVGPGALREREGRPLLAGLMRDAHEGVHEVTPGTLKPAGGSLRLYCRDGWIDFDRPKLRRRLRWALMNRVWKWVSLRVSA